MRARVSEGRPGPWLVLWAGLLLWSCRGAGAREVPSSSVPAPQRAEALDRGASIGSESTASGLQERPGVAPAETLTLASWVGPWRTSFGELSLEAATGNPDGDESGAAALVGAYPGGRLEGRLEGRRLWFHYADEQGRGEGWFELQGDGRSFLGLWCADGDSVWQPWSGERAVPPTGFEGLWDTPFGRLRIGVDGGELTGCYESVLRSRIEGRLHGARDFEGRYLEPEARGRVRFRLAEDGQSFEGSWWPQGSESPDDARPWSGTRVLPEPGVVWLVVLEAHWEESLREPRYAFGDMLAGFFTMASARHVRVRQRFFHDEADFRRFASEVAYLAEPVTLVVSTHGTPEGISVGGATIGPGAIAAGLEHARNLRLLHLSGCSMMDGPVPAAIHDALRGAPGDRPHFPISGYSTDVAWDSSAISDFTYLTLLLIRGWPPGEALEQTRRVAPFTADAAPRGAAFVPLGLRLLEP